MNNLNNKGKKIFTKLLDNLRNFFLNIIWTNYFFVKVVRPIFLPSITEDEQ